MPLTSRRNWLLPAVALLGEMEAMDGAGGQVPQDRAVTASAIASTARKGDLVIAAIGLHLGQTGGRAAARCEVALREDWRNQRNLTTRPPDVNIIRLTGKALCALQIVRRPQLPTLPAGALEVLIAGDRQMAALGADEFAVWMSYHRPELVAQHAIRASEHQWGHLLRPRGILAN